MTVSLQEPNANPDVIALFYKTRYESAETRYCRMKGLARSALYKVHCIEQENKSLRAAQALHGLDLKPLYFHSLLSTFTGNGIMHDKDNVAALVMELERVRGEKAQLIEDIRTLQGPRVVVEDRELRGLYESAIAEALEYKPMVAKLRAQITAMEYEWTQAKTLRDELFDYEDKLREWETVANVMCLDRRPVAGSKVFAVSHRHMLEILVENRNRNINGFLTPRVMPLETLRLEKDAEILELRKTVRMLELASGVSRMDHTLPVELAEEEAAYVRLHSVTNALRDGRVRLDELTNSVKRLEDRAADWDSARREASEFIHKAEKLRSEYGTMMASIRSERAKANRTAEDLNGCMRDLMREMDEMEGEIEAKECLLVQLRAKRGVKERMLAAEKEKIAILEREIAQLAEWGLGSAMGLV
jgi:hypothetical protein